MQLQNWQMKDEKIRNDFRLLKQSDPGRLESKLSLSWSNWVFGMESLASSAGRLARNGIHFIELHGNRYGESLGYDAREARRVLDDFGIKVSGICGIFSPDNDLSSNRGVVRQRAVDYIKQNVELGRELGAKYFLIVPSAVGRPKAIDDMEFSRSVETLSLVADVFVEAGIRGAIEPIRSAEVSLVHTFADAERYIRELDHPGVQHINGDVYHMLVEESHISDTILENGSRLTNLHLADTNRCALGDGSLDLDTLIMALYLIGYNNEWCFCTPEPLGPGGDPYPAMFGKPDVELLDSLVRKTALTWKEREEVVRTGL
ncbi:MAG TPA: sugar phosphate isomerase/epimerase family protein [Armatimonadota bacterium]